MKNIFVGNLNFGTSEQSILSLVQTYGTVEKVTLVRDRDSGQPRGFAFVEMSNDDQARKAIDGLNGTNLDGRTLNITEARFKEDRSGRGQRRYKRY
jgi:RNA recognition motif-containing protein